MSTHESVAQQLSLLYATILSRLLVHSLQKYKGKDQQSTMHETNSSISCDRDKDNNDNVILNDVIAQQKVVKVHWPTDVEIGSSPRIKRKLQKANFEIHPVTILDSGVFTKADKGNVTVALDKKDYIKKMEDMLNDKNTYIVVKKDPMKSLEKNLNTMLKKWKEQDYISETTQLRLRSSDSNLPLAYGLTFGTPMGSPLSPIIADLVLRDIEEKALNSLNFCCTFYFRYVDDIILAAPEDKIEVIKDTFNNIHRRLQFTVEFEQNHMISFLDLLLIVEDGINGYPIDFIFKYFNRRIKNLIQSKKIVSTINDNSNNTINDNSNNNNNVKKKYMVLPFIQGITHAVTNMFNKSLYKIGYRCLNKLDMFIKTLKDKKEIASNNNVVYKIPCKNCDITYVGQTKRKLSTRIKEHMNNKKLEQSRHSVLTNHILQCNHEFDWNNTKIMDYEPNYNKRLISETLHIKEQLNGINLKKDTESLDDVYVHLLERIGDNKQ
ncbi:PREDICTED: uncharacterized protein LOC108776248 [Cyphomyrmex costatus]|uniref:uncharacterized protein LOC108776248 n=1 Tax=Cyphomyrmex costatus TaxID=456900 RepID=UPI0008523187|nr:PREDICTED: uncharacterized protein LOC108776248 [Cyphomyrmex costatus]